MEKDKKILYAVYFIIVGIATALVVCSCSTQGIERGRLITFSPDSLTLKADSANQLALNVKVNIPKHYFSKRSRLFIIPVLRDSDSTLAEYKPLVLDAPIYSKKTERKWVLDSIVDPYKEVAQKVKNNRKAFTVNYMDTLKLPANVQQAKLIALVSADGCGTCQGISHTKIADIYRPKIEKRLHLNWMQQAFEIKPKIRKGEGVAHLQFVINKYDINLKMGNNEQELKHMLSDIAPIMSDSLATLNSLSIYGMASADGSLKFNTPLARNRANSAKQWLMAHLENGEMLNKIIKIGSRPEGWKPVLDAMTADGNADSIQVKRILDQYAAYNDDVQEKYIRRLPIWSLIRQKYLQKDRKVEYTYSYVVKSFTTDQEMLNMYEKRPDAFSEDELLHVAELADNAERQKQVYETTLKYYPASSIAANNLAILLEKEGKVNEAEEVLNKQKAASKR